jgi:hypothetical protein
MNPLFLFLLLDRSSGSGKDTVQRILPAMTPGPTGVALAAVFAKQARQSEEQASKDLEDANRDIVAEVVKTDGIANEEALKSKFPKLHELAFLKLPKAVQGSIFSAASGEGRSGGARKP